MDFITFPAILSRMIHHYHHPGVAHLSDQIAVYSIRLLPINPRIGWPNFLKGWLSN
jgi:hypothetical protein